MPPRLHRRTPRLPGPEAPVPVTRVPHGAPATGVAPARPLTIRGRWAATPRRGGSTAVILRVRILVLARPASSAHTSSTRWRRAGTRCSAWTCCTRRRTPGSRSTAGRTTWSWATSATGPARQAAAGHRRDRPPGGHGRAGRGHRRPARVRRLQRPGHGGAALRRSAGGGVRRLVLASSMVVYGEGRYACATHGAVRPGPRAWRTWPPGGSSRDAGPAGRS